MMNEAALDRVVAARNWDGKSVLDEVPANLEDLVPRRVDYPRVTIITPCHDDGGFLIDAVASVRATDSSLIEMIIVDDHSRDPLTQQVLSELEALGMTIRSSDGVGVACARNTGLSHARGEFVVPLDADNMLRPALIPAALEMFDGAPHLGVVHSDGWRFGVESGLWPVADPSDAELLCSNYFDQCAVIRRAALDAVDGWCQDVNGSEDWALWIALLNAGWGRSTVPVVGFDYRMRVGSLRATLTLKRRAEHLVRLVERYPEIYRSHLVELVPMFVAPHLLDVASAAESDLSTANGRRDHDHVAYLTQRLEAADAAAARAYQRLGEVDEIARRDRRAVQEDLAALREQLEHESHRADDAVQHLHAFQNTKLVRFARIPREIYARIRPD